MTVLEKVRASLAHGADAVRQVIGAPDYKRYLAHLRTSHPDQEPVSAQEFTRARLANRYSKPGSRCC